MRVNQPTSNQVQNNESTSTKKASNAKSAKGAQATETAKAAAGATTAKGADSVNAEISDRGRDSAKAQAVAVNAPDIREEKIAELKKRIAAGTYNVDPKAVADRMVDDHLKTGIG